jgi:hypothetical protein
VFTLPAPIADIAYQNKAEIYAILFKATAETLLTIAADPKHLGARIGLTAVLHTWGSALTHHPHVHCIVPGGGLALNGERWISCRPGFFLPVRVLSRLFRRLFLEQLAAAQAAGRLRFFGDHAPLAERHDFAAYLAPLRKIEWVVYAKRPFAGPQAVLAYLSRYTHRVAIANSRLIACDDNGVTFKWKDYRAKGRQRQKVMTLASDEFIRRFLIHVLPGGFHRIRHYGLFANGGRAENLARVRDLLGVPPPQDEPGDADARSSSPAPRHAPVRRARSGSTHHDAAHDSATPIAARPLLPVFDRAGAGLPQRRTSVRSCPSFQHTRRLKLPRLATPSPSAIASRHPKSTTQTG